MIFDVCFYVSYMYNVCIFWALLQFFYLRDLVRSFHLSIAGVANKNNSKTNVDLQLTDFISEINCSSNV